MTTDVLDRFLSQLPFAPDLFQIEALSVVDGGGSVVVTAPTGAGKTLVADGSIAMTVANGERAFYTTPIKALSNQKFNDLINDHGAERVGLLTGDNVINGDAPIVVMTTEVLRNMIYEGSSALDNLGLVVLDEVHYLADRHRGSVWEEIIIHLPKRIKIVCLSATVANPEAFTEWVRQRRGRCDLVVETNRPVPLTSMYMWRDRHKDGRVAMAPVFGKNGRPNGAIRKLLQSSRGRHRRFATPRRVAVVKRLNSEGLLPCIYFVFSRKGCDQTAEEVANAGIELTSAAERVEIRAIAERHIAHLTSGDLSVLGLERWMATLQQGAAAHHAGLIPAFKEAVEELFLAGLVKFVAATETLALGINMPARTVVLDSLSKFDGERHELLKASDFTQLTGRAGRRGIDENGAAVVLFSPYVPFDRVTAIAARGANPLKSSFTPTYNMAVNLIARYDSEEAYALLGASFANFAADYKMEQLSANLDDRRRDAETFRSAALGDRARRAERDVRRLERRIERADTNDIADEFDRIKRVLDATAYTRGWALTGRGRSLRRICSELDLLLAETLRVGVFNALGPPEFGALASIFTYQARGGEVSQEPQAGFASEPIDRVAQIAALISNRERHEGVQESRHPDVGLVDSMHAWASGLDLADIFAADDLRAGDFVRSSRQLIDLLRQIRDGFPDYRRVANQAISSIDRGIVEVGGPQ